MLTYLVTGWGGGGALGASISISIYTQEERLEL